MFTKEFQTKRKPRKKHKGLRQKSLKKQAAERDRKRVLELLKKQRGNKCELNFVSGCSKRAEGLHEPLKQSASPWKPGDFERGRLVKLACNLCNGAIEDEPLRAKREGHSVSRFNSQ